MASQHALQAAQTPLIGRAPIEAQGVTIRELPLAGKVTLRGNADNPAFASAAKTVLGVNLPVTPLGSAEAGETRVFWKAFDEWLIWTAPGAENALIAALLDALKGLRHAVVDVSDYYTILRIEGSNSRTLLSKGCVIDLHPRAFASGQATGTGFHHATIFITKNNEESFDVMIRWSFADYLWLYLADGAREWM